MADTFTSKLGLRQYDATLNYAVSKFSADNLLIDNAIGTVICTSSTRPSTGLFNGMQLWETDTQRWVIRVAAAWVPVSTPLIVANQAARDAITTKYDGQQVYRQDKDWMEVYDGSAWRVQGEVTVGALADITNPYTGQCVTLTSDFYKYRWSGSAWLPFGCITSANTAEYSRSTVQSIPNNSVQRIDFLTADKTSSDISKATVSGGSEFTINKAGRWLIQSNGGLVGSGGGTTRAWWIGRTTDTPRHATIAFGPAGFFAAMSVNKEINFAVNDKFVIFAYQDSGGALNTEITQATTTMTARWMGPV